MPANAEEAKTGILACLLLALVILLAPTTPEAMAKPGSEDSGWACGSCQTEEGHRWRMDVVIAQYRKDLATYEQRRQAEVQCKKELLASPRVANPDGTTTFGCSSASWGVLGYSQFTLAATGESYEVDICLDHGELRIRRVK